MYDGRKEADRGCAWLSLFVAGVLQRIQRCYSSLDILKYLKCDWGSAVRISCSKL